MDVANFVWMGTCSDTLAINNVADRQTDRQTEYSMTPIEE